jgi:hypothetical protein
LTQEASRAGIEALAKVPMDKVVVGAQNGDLRAGSSTERC